MFFTNMNVETKTLRIISLVITLIGIIFILASKYVGIIAIRTSMVLIFFLCALNFKSVYEYANTKEKINNILGIAASILIFVEPQFAMFIVGVAILIMTVPVLYKMIKNKEFSDVVMFTVSAIGTAFSIYCIVNSRAALNTVIIIIGISFVILGCLLLFQTFDINRNKKKYATYEKEKQDYHFTDVE